MSGCDQDYPHSCGQHRQKDATKKWLKHLVRSRVDRVVLVGEKGASGSQLDHQGIERVMLPSS